MSAGLLTYQLRGKATHTRLAKRALGWFDTKHTGIRLVDVRSLTTAMHEIGHHIDYTLSGRISKTPPTSAIGVELTKLGKALYGNKKAAGGYKSEGFAEYIRKYLTDDSPESTPALHKWFTETYLEEHTDISSKLAKTKTMIDKWRMQGAEARVDSQISTKKIKGSWSERIEKGMLWLDTQRDELAPIRTAMKNAGIGKDELSPSDDPYQIAVARADTAGAIAEHFVIEYTTDLAGNRTGKGLREVLAPVSKDIKNFTRWIVAARARLLLKKVLILVSARPTPIIYMRSMITSNGRIHYRRSPTGITDLLIISSKLVECPQNQHSLSKIQTQYIFHL